MRKKLLSMLLAVAMIFAMVPVTTSAYNDEESNSDLYVQNVTVQERGGDNWFGDGSQEPLLIKNIDFNKQVIYRNASDFQVSLELTDNSIIYDKITLVLNAIATVGSFDSDVVLYYDYSDGVYKSGNVTLNWYIDSGTRNDSYMNYGETGIFYPFLVYGEKYGNSRYGFCGSFGKLYGDNDPYILNLQEIAGNHICYLINADKLTCTEHQWDSGQITQEATSSSSGIMTYTCTICGTTTTKEIPAITPANPFADVSESDWYYDTVVAVYSKGLIKGTSSTTFDPLSSMTRAQFAVVLYRMEGSPATTYVSKFTDVPDGTWYSTEVTWAANTGVVNGYGNGLYGTDDNITREQMAVMMYRYGQYKGYDVSASASFDSFPDASSVSSFATEAMKWCVAEGIIQGKSGTYLDPQGYATRAEAATILNRFDERYN